jgi:hypothetical protein
MTKLLLVRIESYHFVKPEFPVAFQIELSRVGEHAISYT